MSRLCGGKGVVLGCTVRLARLPKPNTQLEAARGLA